MLTGSLTTIIWTEIPALNAMLSVRAVSFGLAFLAVIVGSLLGKNANETTARV